VIRLLSSDIKIKGLQVMTKKTKKKTKKQRKQYCPKCKDLGRKVEGKEDVCPYQSEINGVEEICWCCSDCRHECLMDI
jgi:hypothetical protein